MEQRWYTQKHNINKKCLYVHGSNTPQQTNCLWDFSICTGSLFQKAEVMILLWIGI